VHHRLKPLFCHAHLLPALAPALAPPSVGGIDKGSSVQGTQSDAPLPDASLLPQFSSASACMCHDVMMPQPIHTNITTSLTQCKAEQRLHLCLTLLFCQRLTHCKAQQRLHHCHASLLPEFDSVQGTTKAAPLPDASLLPEFASLQGTTEAAPLPRFSSARD